MTNKLINDFINNWQVKRGRTKTQETKNTYQDVLERFVSFIEQSDGNILQLTEFDVKQYFKQLKERTVTKKGNKTGAISDATIRKHYTVIKTFLTYIGHEEYMRDIEYPEQDKTIGIAPKSLLPEDVNRIYRRAEQRNIKTNGQWKKGGKLQVAIIRLMLETGLRVSELVNLNKRDVTMNERKGHLDFIGKGNKRRQVPIPKESRNKLKDYLAERTDQEEALFVSNNGKRLTVRNVQQLVARIGEECGFREEQALHPHMFRHTWCYNAVKKLPLSTVTHLAGHSDPRTTLIYTSPDMEEAGLELDHLYG